MCITQQRLFSLHIRFDNAYTHTEVENYLKRSYFIFYPLLLGLKIHPLLLGLKIRPLLLELKIHPLLIGTKNSPLFVGSVPVK